MSNAYLKKIVEFLYGISLKRCSTVFFQNEDDLKLFVGNNLIDSASAKLIPGSGIDLEKFKISTSLFPLLLLFHLLQE